MKPGMPTEAAHAVPEGSAVRQLVVWWRSAMPKHQAPCLLEARTKLIELPARARWAFRRRLKGRRAGGHELGCNSCDVRACGRPRLLHLLARTLARPNTC